MPVPKKTYCTKVEKDIAGLIKDGDIKVDPQPEGGHQPEKTPPPATPEPKKPGECKVERT